LLVLRGEHASADLAPQLLDNLEAIPIRLQQFPNRAVINLALADRIIGGFGAYRWDDQLGPISLNQDAGEVIDVEPLHRDDDQTLCRDVEPAESGVAEPIDCIPPCDLRFGVIGLYRIVDDQDPTATAGQRTADRSGQARAALRRFELALRRLSRVQPRPGKQALIKRRLE